MLVILFLTGLYLGLDYVLHPSGSYWHRLTSRQGPQEERNARLEQALQTRLAEAGLRTGDLSKERISPKKKSGQTWNYIEREYTLPPPVTFETVRKKVKEAAAEAQAEVQANYLERNGRTRFLGMALGWEGRAAYWLQFKKEDGRTGTASLPREERRPRSPVSISGTYKIAIIIDDLGTNYTLAHSFMALGKPLTLSFLPHQTYTRELSREAQELGYEVMLHLPMEPQGYPDIDPGEGALKKDMSPEKLKETLQKDLESVPAAAGVNNHMGSRLTEDTEAMRAVMAELKKRGLFFVDSKTTAKSVAARVAKEMELPSANRQVFLDNEEKEDYIRRQLELLARTAKKRGSAVAIAHPHPLTVKVLEEELPKLEKQGFQIVRVSELLRPALAKKK